MERFLNLTRILFLLVLLSTCTNTLFAQVSAAFTAQVGCNGEVTFIAANSGYTSYNWLFVDLASGTGPTTFHQYATGTYSATLIVQDNSGFDSVTQQIFISDYVQQ